MTEPEKHQSECMIIKLENQPAQVSGEGGTLEESLLPSQKLMKDLNFFESKIHSLTNTAVMNPFFIQQFVK
jgi:hypothetical protein